MPNDLSTKIQKARKAGYTDQQIKTFLASSGLNASAVDSTPPERPVGVDIAIGAAKGLGKTVQTLGQGAAQVALGQAGSIPGVRDAVASGVKKYQSAFGITDENLRPTNTAQKVGMGVELAAEALTPLAASKFARAGIALTREGGEVAANIASKTGSYTAGRLPKLLGIFTGESDDVVRAALRNPSLADEGIEGGDEALRAAVREGSENSVKIRNSFVQAHKTAKTQVLGKYAGVLEPKNNVIGTFNKLLESNGVKIGKDGTLDFTTSKLVANPGEVTKIQNAYAALKQWDKFTLDALDDYKQLVGQLTRFADESGIPSKSPFLGRLYNELNQIALNRLPKEVAAEYSNLNRNFSQNIELYDEIVEAFNSGDPFVKLANSLGKNKDSLRQVLEFYAKQEGGSDVLPIVAGRELAMEKTAAFGLLNPRSWIDLLISPQKQAKITTRVGKILQRAKPPTE